MRESRWFSTPLHRSFARFNETNVQPAECYQNRIGEYIDPYIDAIKEAGNIWGIPVIDFKQEYIHKKGRLLKSRP